MAGHALPAFHTLGIIVQLLVSLYAMTPVALYPPIAPTPTSTPMLPSPDNILKHLKRTNSNCVMVIPALLQIWAQDPKAVAFLASIEFVVRDLIPWVSRILDVTLYREYRRIPEVQCLRSWETLWQMQAFI